MKSTKFETKLTAFLNYCAVFMGNADFSMVETIKQFKISKCIGSDLQEFGFAERSGSGKSVHWRWLEKEVTPETVADFSRFVSLQNERRNGRDKLPAPIVQPEQQSLLRVDQLDRIEQMLYLLINELEIKHEAVS